MRQDIILAGVGGQGILSIAFVIDNAALKKGLYVKQAEVHGMAQRGGAVQSHLRLSEQPVYSDLIPKGEADLILSVEPLESLRYVDYLRPDGIIITSSTPMINIPNYPDIDIVVETIREIKGSVIVDSAKLAREAGLARAQNMVMLGAASGFLILGPDDLREFIRELFRGRQKSIISANLKAFDLGQKSRGHHT
jgi:indolepyruvate ferredoxin oxidoreductase beta subunit